MFKLITETNVIPKSLFISDVKIDTETGATNIGGIGRVFRGEHKGQVVALKLLDKGHDKDVCVSLPASFTILIRVSRARSLKTFVWKS